MCPECGMRPIPRSERGHLAAAESTNWAFFPLKKRNMEVKKGFSRLEKKNKTKQTQKN